MCMSIKIIPVNEKIHLLHFNSPPLNEAIIAFIKR